MSERKCPRCGNDVENPDSIFCNNCEWEDTVQDSIEEVGYNNWVEGQEVSEEEK